jgi:hypothetical protein
MPSPQQFSAPFRMVLESEPLQPREDKQKGRQIAGPEEVLRGDPRRTSGVRLLGKNLAAAIHAGLQIDMVGTTQFARILVLDVGRGLQGIGGTAEAALHAGGFSLRNSHWFLLRGVRMP